MAQQDLDAVVQTLERLTPVEKLVLIERLAPCKTTPLLSLLPSNVTRCAVSGRNSKGCQSVTHPMGLRIESTINFFTVMGDLYRYWDLVCSIRAQ
jgi:hypothetical protein